MPPPFILPVGPSVVPPLWISHTDSLPPANGVSLVRQDGFMETSPTLSSLLAETIQFQSPDVFHESWRPEPPTTQPPLKLTLPPSSKDAEKALRIIGRTIYRELKDQGSDDQRILQVANGILAFFGELSWADRGSSMRGYAESREDREESRAAAASLSEEFQWRMRTVYEARKEANLMWGDLLWLPNELLACILRNRGPKA